MPPHRKLSDPSTAEYATLSQLRRMKKETRIEAMRHWFGDNYDAPDELPYDSGEGGYQWIWGGPYDADPPSRAALDRRCSSESTRCQNRLFLENSSFLLLYANARTHKGAFIPLQALTTKAVRVGVLQATNSL